MKTIFIGGCDRSGTTLLGSMLGASPDAVCTPESQFKTEILERGNAAKLLRSPRMALAAIAEHWRFTLWGLSPGQFRDLRYEQSARYDTLLQGLVSRYAKSQRRNGSSVDSPKFWVDHTPSNIRHLNRLFSIFPDAVSIHIVRDGRAVAASVTQTDWGPNTVFFAAKWWMQQLSLGLAAEQFFGPKKVMRVRFEDLVSSPKTELKRICRFAGLEYIDALCNANGFRVPRYTAVQHQRLLAGGVNKNRAYDWKYALTKKQITLFEFVTGDLLPILGYALENPWPAAPSPFVLAMTGAWEALFWLRNRVRRFLRKRRFLRP